MTHSFTNPLFLYFSVISVVGARVSVFVSHPKHRKVTVVSIIHRQDRVYI